MGWNFGYTIFEATVIGAYNLGKLDEALLSVLMEPYRGTDIDSGGSRDLTTSDGLSVEEVVIAIMAPAKWAELNDHRIRIRDYPDYKQQTESQQDDVEAYYDARYDAFSEIVDGRFGWE